jgi:hypothetical protein
MFNRIDSFEQIFYLYDGLSVSLELLEFGILCGLEQILILELLEGIIKSKPGLFIVDFPEILKF